MLRAQLQKELYDKHHNTADGRIRVWFGIRQIMNSTDRLLLETRDAARQLKTGIHLVWDSVACVYAFIMCVFSFIAIYQLQARGSLHYDTYNLLEFLEDDYLIDLFNACSSLLVKLEKC